MDDPVGPDGPEGAVRPARDGPRWTRGGRPRRDGRGPGWRRGAPSPPAEAREFLDEGRVRRVGPLDLAGDDALLEQQDAIGELGDEVEVLLHHHDGDPLLAVQVAQEVDDGVHDGGLDAFRRLVEEDELGLGDEAPGDREELLLATRECTALAVEERLEPWEPGEDPPHRLLLVSSVGREPHPDVVVDGEGRKDAAPLRNVAEPEPRALARPLAGEVEPRVADEPSGSGDDSHDGLEERGLAHSVVAEHPDDLPFLDREVHPVQHRNPIVAGAQRLDLEERAHDPGPGPGPVFMSDARDARGRPRARAGRRRLPPWCPPSGCAPRGTRSRGPRSSG